jgi:hypothetical protein
VARDGTNFVFGPYPDQSYTIQGWYYAAATLLSPNNPSTWLVTSDPDLMLAACLKEVGPFLRDDKALSMWTGIYNAKLAALIAKDMADRWSGATMQIETG